MFKHTGGGARYVVILTIHTQKKRIKKKPSLIIYVIRVDLDSWFVIGNVRFINRVDPFIIDSQPFCAVRTRERAHTRFSWYYSLSNDCHLVVVSHHPVQSPYPVYTQKERQAILKCQHSQQSAIVYLCTDEAAIFFLYAKCNLLVWFTWIVSIACVQ